MCAMVISVDGRDFSLCGCDPDHIWMQRFSHVFDLASLLVANSEYFKDFLMCLILHHSWLQIQNISRAQVELHIFNIDKFIEKNITTLRGEKYKHSPEARHSFKICGWMFGLVRTVAMEPFLWFELIKVTEPLHLFCSLMSLCSELDPENSGVVCVSIVGIFCDWNVIGVDLDDTFRYWTIFIGLIWCWYSTDDSKTKHVNLKGNYSEDCSYCSNK